MANEITPAQPKTQIALASTGLQLTTLNDLWRFAECVKSSGFAPKGYETPEAVFVGVQFGAEIGLTPMQSLQNIAVIQGRPSIWGDAAKALVLSSGLCEGFSEKLTGEGDAMVATCTVKRKGFDEPIVASFSVHDAKRASLWGKQGPWTQYPKRMLQLRARSFALRDGFPDVLKGLSTREEAQDTADHEAVNAVFENEPNPGKRPTSQFEEARREVRRKRVEAPDPEPVVVTATATVEPGDDEPQQDILL